MIHAAGAGIDRAVDGVLVRFPDHFDSVEVILGHRDHRLYEGCIRRECARKTAALLPGDQGIVHFDPDVLVDARRRGPQVGIRADDGYRVRRRREFDVQARRIHIGPGGAVAAYQLVLVAGRCVVGRSRRRDAYRRGRDALRAPERVIENAQRCQARLGAMRAERNLDRAR